MPDENDNMMETSFGSHSLEPSEREQLRAASAQLRKRKERSRRVLKDDLTRKIRPYSLHRVEPHRFAFSGGIRLLRRISSLPADSCRSGARGSLTF